MELDYTGLGATAVFIIVILREVFGFVQSKRNGKHPTIPDELRAILKELDHKMERLLAETGEAAKFQQIHFSATRGCPKALNELARLFDRITSTQDSIAKTLERIEMKRFAAK